MRVVIHYDKNGFPGVYADPGITVYSVDEQVPEDRVYLMAAPPIPAGLLFGTIHHHGDGSDAEKRLHDGLGLPRPVRTGDR